MSIEGLLSMSGLGEFVDQDFFVAQVALLGGTVLFFILSCVFCIMAFRSAIAARDARGEAQAYFKSAEDLAVEVRRLTAQVEATAQNKRAPMTAPIEGAVSASVPANLAASDDEAEPANDVATVQSAETDAPAEGASSEAGVAVDPKAAQSVPKAGDNTLSFVDGKESLLKAPAFVGQGVPSTELDGALSEHDLADRDAAGETAKASPLSSLLRRRRF